MNAWASLESALDADPLFYVQRPDGLKHLSEDAGSIALVNLVHRLAPKATIQHPKNEGKHNHVKAKAMGVVAGFPDYIVTWPVRGQAFIEMKGFTAAGRPGELFQAQIDQCNKLYRQGFPVACFFSPDAAFEWLVAQGMPSIGRVAA